MALVLILILVTLFHELFRKFFGTTQLDSNVIDEDEEFEEE